MKTPEEIVYERVKGILSRSTWPDEMMSLLKRFMSNENLYENSIMGVYLKSDDPIAKALAKEQNEINASFIEAHLMEDQAKSEAAKGNPEKSEGLKKAAKQLLESTEKRAEVFAQKMMSDYEVLYRSSHYAAATSKRDVAGTIATNAIDVYFIYAKSLGVTRDNINTPSKSRDEMKIKCVLMLINFYQTINGIAGAREKVVRPFEELVSHAQYEKIRKIFGESTTSQAEAEQKTRDFLQGKIAGPLALKKQSVERALLFLDQYLNYLQITPELVQNAISHLTETIPSTPSPTAAAAASSSQLPRSEHHVEVDEGLKILDEINKRMAITTQEAAQLEQAKNIEAAPAPQARAQRR